MIKDKAYNDAKKILEDAGSDSAKKSHKKHTGKKGSPDGHGTSLLDEAKADFKKLDKGKDDLNKDGITAAHQTALDKAKKKLGI